MPFSSIAASPQQGGKKESTSHRLSQLCPPCATPSSTSSPDRHSERRPSRYAERRPVDTAAGPDDRRFLQRGNDRDVLQRTQWPEHKWLRISPRGRERRSGLPETQLAVWEAALRGLAATEDRSLKFNLMAHPFWSAYLDHTLQSRLVTWLETLRHCGTPSPPKEPLAPAPK
jgi:hypothetical protein